MSGLRRPFLAFGQQWRAKRETKRRRVSFTPAPCQSHCCQPTLAPDRPIRTRRRVSIRSRPDKICCNLAFPHVLIPASKWITCRLRRIFRCSSCWLNASRSGKQCRRTLAFRLPETPRATRAGMLPRSDQLRTSSHCDATIAVKLGPDRCFRASARRHRSGLVALATDPSSDSSYPHASRRRKARNSPAVPARTVKR